MPAVEQRILDMQKRKQGLADASMGEGSAVSASFLPSLRLRALDEARADSSCSSRAEMGKLTVADLAGLFGLNMRGERV